MVSDKEFSEQVHMEIHAVRRLPNYKPTVMEKNISKFVIERFTDECKECRDIGTAIKNRPEQKSFFNKLGGILNE